MEIYEKERAGSDVLFAKAVFEKVCGTVISASECIFIGSGKKNVAYAIKDRIIRIPREDSDRDDERYVREKFAIDTMEKRGINVSIPHVYHTGIIEGIPYSICERMQGKELSFPCSPEQAYRLGRKLGVALTEIHAIELSGFGLLSTEGKGEYESLKEYLHYYLKSGLDYLRVTEYMGEEEIVALQDLLKQAIPVLAKYETNSCLNVNDMTPNNILVDEGGTMSGLIDFELAESNIPLKDIAKMKYLNERINGIFPAFLETYVHPHILSDFEQTLPFQTVELAVRINKIFHIDDPLFQIGNASSVQEKAEYLLGKIRSLISQIRKKT